MGFCKIISENLNFSYGREKIIKGVDIEVQEKDVLIIKGPNGSGKSTLLKLLSGILSKDSGKLIYLNKEKELKPHDYPYYFGLCSVEQNLYEELTISENLEFLMKLRGINNELKLKNYLDKANLNEKKDVFYKNLSSGMKQRVKIISSVLHSPIFLFLDEPGSNLDENGYDFLNSIITEQKERGISIIATNDKREYIYGNKTIELSL